MPTGSEARADASNATRTAAAVAAASWGWLYPATYAIHLLEEWRGGEGFTAWMARAVGVELSAGRFLVWNVVALLLMSAGVLLTMRFKRLRWLLLAYGTAFLLNALSHLAASLYTNSYSPGLVSSLLLWLPLGAWTLLRLKPTVLLLTLFGGRLGV
jgi:hypothetical protein